LKWYHVVLFLAAILVYMSDVGCAPGCDSVEEPEPELTVATPLYPENARSGMSRSPVFVWDGHLEEDDDGSYEFTVSLVRRYPAEYWLFSTGSDTIFQFPDTLEPGIYYSWKVITEASGGRSEESSSNGFTTGTGFNNPPTRPKALNPPIDGTEIPLDVTFLWFSFDPDGDGLTYDLWYRREQDADSIHVLDLITPEFSAMLDADTRYRWNMISRDEHGAESNGFPHWFTTITTPPPYDPFPADGAEDMPFDVTLSWSCTDPDGDVLTYDVEMGRTGGSMSSIGTDLTQDELPVVGLSEGVTYEWKVTAEDDDGHRTEGPVWSFTTVGLAGDVFADLTLTRHQTASVVIDMIWARFDEDYAPQYWSRPLQADTVECGDHGLAWQPSRNRHYYENAHTLSFLVPGTEYTFTITGGDGVPSLTESIIFPQCAPLITSPLAYDPVSMDGFTVTWSGYDDFADCDRQVSIAILDIAGDSTGVYITTDNDGSYTFSAGELSVIDPSLMDLQIVLVVENVMNIDSPGYDPRSWIRARTLTAQTVYQD